MAKKELRLEFTDYVVKGIALIKLWGSDIPAYVDVKPYHINDLSETEILSGINDGGFGCEQIIKAEIFIYENYEGYEKYLTSMVVQVPPNCGKRGI